MKDDFEMQELRAGKWIEIAKYGYPKTTLNNKAVPYYESEWVSVFSRNYDHPLIAKYQHGTTKSGTEWGEWVDELRDPYAILNVTHWLKLPPL
jgi:hypothetical protein